MMRAALFQRKSRSGWLEVLDTIRVDALEEPGAGADVVDASEKLGNRIRKAKNEKLPYVLVVVDDDVAARTVGVNARGVDVERGVSVDEFAQRVVDEDDDQIHVR